MNKSWHYPIVDTSKFSGTIYTREEEPTREEIPQGSWTIAVPPKLQRMADLAGLQIEVRVWHE